MLSDAAITSIVTGLVSITTMVIGFLTLWVKLRHGAEKAEEAAVKAEIVESKIDGNTKLAIAATTQAAENAEIAATAANQAAKKAEEMVARLNGPLDERIRTIVRERTESLITIMKQHTEQDDKNMQEIRQALSELQNRTKVIK